MSLSRNDSALGAFYRRLCTRMDKPRANTAVAHKLARMVYFMRKHLATTVHFFLDVSVRCTTCYLL
ncbi:hypothetical protein SBC2_77760 (plasmid) [Caballeronia sp. SBC2]|nr:hypothetical protein SBC2_77760 [Caballeronia sp. SBC2]